jgi:fibronectin type 3 domain-containing protein
MDTFNASIGTSPEASFLHAAQLQQADSNTGPAVYNGLAGSLIQAQELQAMGFQAVKISIGFPLLYEGYWGSQSAMQPYLTFYEELVADIQAMGMKVIVENTILLTNQPEAGSWNNPPLTAYYAGLSWPEYMAGRATMAATIAQDIKPDYLVLAEEPDTEAAATGQSNLNNPVDAAAMIAGEIVSVRLVNLTIPLGAGFGTWLGAFPPDGLLEYVLDYVALPLDYIDYHMYPILTWEGTSYLSNALLIAQQAQLAGKPVAVSESWLWKTENSEYNVQPPDFYRTRDPFSFWATLDENFGITMQNLANYTQANYTPILYLSAQGTDYFFQYETYGGTVANGGAANCTCTTDSCTESIILDNANSDASNADQIADFTVTAYSYNARLVSPPDTEPPSAPTALVGTAGYGTASLSWTASSDNVGVAGYNVLRCAPNPPTQPCTGVWIANTAWTTYVDYGPLNISTQYNYQVQAFDMANNNSALSNTLSLTTAGSLPPNSPTGLIATAATPTEIKLTWVPPTTGTVSQYQVWSGASKNDLTQIATTPGTSAKFTNMPLNPATTYYYGVIAVESKLPSSMSPIASATTLPLPNSPTSVTATPTSASKITLAWTENVPPLGLAVSNYKVYASTTNGDFPTSTTTKGTSYSSTSLEPGTTYYFEIVAVDSAGDDSVASTPVSATTLPLPPAPTNVAAAATAATKVQVTWNWSPAPGGAAAAHFTVYCGTAPTGQPKAGTASSPTATSFTWTGATASTKYYCYVVATDTDNDNSPDSANATAITPPMPNAPTNVSATASSATKVVVTWSETVPPGGLPISSYKIYRSTSLPVTTADFVATRTTASYTDTTVVGSTTYYYAISAIDSGQDASTLSAPGSVTTP